MKSNKGITLVALVITIIVLLILAGVSISLVVGDNGVLTQASNASKNTSVAEAKEKVEQAISSLQGKFVNKWSGDTTAIFIDTINTGGAGKDADYNLSTEMGGTGKDYSVALGTYKAAAPSATPPTTAKYTDCEITVNGEKYKFDLVGSNNKLGATINWK